MDLAWPSPLQMHVVTSLVHFEGLRNPAQVVHGRARGGLGVEPIRGDEVADRHAVDLVAAVLDGIADFLRDERAVGAGSPQIDMRIGDRSPPGANYPEVFLP